MAVLVDEFIFLNSATWEYTFSLGLVSFSYFLANNFIIVWCLLLGTCLIALWSPLSSIFHVAYFYRSLPLMVAHYYLLSLCIATVAYCRRLSQFTVWFKLSPPLNSVLYVSVSTPERATQGGTDIFFVKLKLNNCSNWLRTSTDVLWTGCTRTRLFIASSSPRNQSHSQTAAATSWQVIHNNLIPPRLKP